MKTIIDTLIFKPLPISWPSDLSGLVFENWLVLKKVKSNKYHQSVYLCRCTCGKEKEVIGTSLRTGKSKCCGHNRLDKMQNGNNRNNS